MVSLSNHVAISMRLNTRRRNRHSYGDEIANPRIEYGVAMTNWLRVSAGWRMFQYMGCGL